MTDDLVPPPEPVPGVSLRRLRLSDLPDVEAVDPARDTGHGVEVTLEPDAPPARGRGAVPTPEQVDEDADAGGDAVTVVEP